MELDTYLNQLGELDGQSRRHLDCLRCRRLPPVNRAQY